MCPTYEHIVLSNHTIVARQGGVGHHVLNGGPLANALEVISGPVFGEDLFPTLVEKACKVAHAIATGHVFSDANKRTAASSLDLIFHLNGHSLAAEETELVDVMYHLAKGDLALADFTAWTATRIATPMHFS